MLWLADLPTDIVLAIIEHAASDFVDSHRSWVVQLALISHATCAIIRPILYSTLVLTGSNEDYFNDNVPTINRILPLVRSFHVINYDSEYGDNIADTANEILNLWTPKASHLSAGWPLLKDFCRRLDEQGIGANALTSISISYEKLAIAIVAQGLPASISDSLTHIDGYIPAIWSTGQEVSPKIWTQAVLDALPNLTHFGLRLVGFDMRRALRRDTSPTPQIVKDIRTVVATALHYRPSMQLIVLLVGGDYLVVRDSLERELAEFQSTGRLRIVYDHRLLSWENETMVELDDAWARRTIWNAPSEIPYLPGTGGMAESDLE